MQLPVITKAAGLKLHDQIDGSVVTSIEVLSNGDIRVLLDNDLDVDYHTFWSNEEFTVIRDVEA